MLDALARARADERRAAAGDRGRRAAARAEDGLFNTRRGDPPRPRARRRARRATCRTTGSTTRSASSGPPATRSSTEVTLLGETVAVRPRPAVRVPRPGRLRPSRRDLRGPVGPDPAQHLRRAGGRDRAREPVGKQHHDRQGRLPPPAVRLAVGAHDRRLPVHRRRAGRVDHRPGLGRTGDDLRERRPAGRG